ncbi:MAG: hypothetical protein IPH72_27740 [Sandaracinaceae bacterium]|nr:hypothetical protein [Sandaracinaceae bacterium]
MNPSLNPSNRGAVGSATRSLASALALGLWLVSAPLDASAQSGIVVQHSGQGSSQPQPAPAQRPSRGRQRNVKVSLGGELGWRYVALGQTRIPRDDDTFMMAYHGALRLDVGGQAGGLYSYLRFDGFAPTGLGTFPWMATARVGYFRNVNYFDAGGPRSSTSTTYTGTTCGYATCYDHYQQRTTSWWEPAGWVNGLRYFYAAGHIMGGTRVRAGDTATQNAGALGLGFGMIETKFSTWFMETELLFFPDRQWESSSRSNWGWFLRGGSLFGPVFVDLTLRLDPAVGGELSIGAGIWLGN